MSEANVQEQVSEMYRQGMGYTVISKTLGIARTTVRRILEKADKRATPIRQHVELVITDIRLDGDTQMRVTLVDSTICDYREEMLAGVQFPPVTVYFDGTDHWLADGFHRLHASMSAGRETIVADIYEGTARDARRHSMGANANHGLRRTNADKRNAVEMALADEEWRELPNTQVAEMCAVAESFVRKIKQEHEYAEKISHSTSLAVERTAVASSIPSVDVAPSPLHVPCNTHEPVIEMPQAEQSAPQVTPAKIPFDFRFNPRLRRLKVTNPSGEKMHFTSRDEVTSFITDLEAHLAVWDGDNGA